MADKQILFSAPMVRALLDGRKTQTRRVINAPSAHDAIAVFGADFLTLRGNFGLLPIRAHRGDRLWVREAWRSMDGMDGSNATEIAANCIEAGYRRPWAPLHYEADGARVDWIAEPRGFGTKAGRYRHARFMPRWASRLTLIVTDVRVQRLQDISGEDSAAEGVCEFAMLPPTDTDAADARIVFRDLWNRLHGPEAWDANPWVAAYSFRVIRANIDSEAVGYAL